MPVCEVYECFSEIIGITLKQLGMITVTGCFGLAALMIVIVRRWR